MKNLMVQSISYGEMNMQQSRKGYYRAYFKGRLALKEKSYGSARIRAFNIREDLMTSQNTSVQLEAVPNAAENGDVLIIIDQYGTKLYSGVIDSIEEGAVELKDILHLFDDSDFYPTGNYSSENCNTKTRYLLQHYRNSNQDDIKITSLIDQFDISENEESQKGWSYDYTEVTTINLYDELLSIFDQYGSKIEIDIPINEGQPAIYTSHVKGTVHKLIDNTVFIPTMTSVLEVKDTNKLIVYNQAGDTKRAVYYLSEEGISQNADDMMRLNIVKTKIVNSDDDLESIVASNLEKEIYNHKITVEMIIDNRLYDYHSFNLGGQFTVSINGKYYSTIWTAYELNMEEGSVLEISKMTFGKVRTKASERYFQ